MQAAGFRPVQAHEAACACEGHADVPEATSWSVAASVAAGSACDAVRLAMHTAAPVSCTTVAVWCWCANSCLSVSVEEVCSRHDMRCCAVGSMLHAVCWSCVASCGVMSLRASGGCITRCTAV